MSTTTDGLRLRAEDADDLAVISSVLQDALVPLADMVHLSEERRFVMVVNRFRWEQEADGGRRKREPAERVHAMLSIHRVRRVRMRGLGRRPRTEIQALLGLVPGEDRIDMEFSGGGTIRVEVDAIDAALADLGEPWPTRYRPSHPED